MNVDICTAAVRILLGSKALTQALGGNRVYQVTAPAAEEYPRVVVSEESREYTGFADDTATLERVVIKMIIFAVENELSKLVSLIHNALKKEGFTRKYTGADNYLPGYCIFIKPLSYEKYIELE